MIIINIRGLATFWRSRKSVATRKGVLPRFLMQNETVQNVHSLLEHIFASIRHLSHRITDHHSQTLHDLCSIHNRRWL